MITTWILCGVSLILFGITTVYLMWREGMELRDASTLSLLITPILMTVFILIYIAFSEGVYLNDQDYFDYRFDKCVQTDNYTREECIIIAGGE